MSLIWAVVSGVCLLQLKFQIPKQSCTVSSLIWAVVSGLFTPIEIVLPLIQISKQSCTVYWQNILLSYQFAYYISTGQWADSIEKISSVHIIGILYNNGYVTG